MIDRILELASKKPDWVLLAFLIVAIIVVVVCFVLVVEAAAAFFVSTAPKDQEWVARIAFAFWLAYIFKGRK